MQTLTHEELENLDMDRHCEKHGPYRAFTMDWITKDRRMLVDNCQACAEEARIAAEAIIEQERIDCDRKRHVANMESSGIANRYLGASLSNIVPTTEQNEVYSALSEFLSAESQHSLILAGTVGTGKTLFAQALAQDLSKAKYRFAYTTARKIIRDIRSTWSKDSERSEGQVIDYYSNVDYLFIDEVGIQHGTDAEQILLFDVINARYENQTPTILITNLDGEGLTQLMGERIIDRLRQDGGTLLAFNWNSLRTQG